MLSADPVIPFELPDVKNHSFFFIDQTLAPEAEAPLHQHEAWEVICVRKGSGKLIVGEDYRDFDSNTVALIGPGIAHRWKYDSNDLSSDGRVSYSMVAFLPAFIDLLKNAFPELRNSLSGVDLKSAGFVFGSRASLKIRNSFDKLSNLGEVERLSEVISLINFAFLTRDRESAGQAIQVEAAVRRIQKAIEIVMRDYSQPISLSKVASEVGMHSSAFSSFFHKHRGETFGHFLSNYRLNVASDLLVKTQKQVSEICYLCGYRDLGHFSRMFREKYGLSPRAFRNKKKID